MTKLNKKILIVEDDKDLLSVLRERFSDDGFSVITALDGEEGLILAENEKPDLFLLDVQIPKMDGVAMAQKLKGVGVNAPIIFLTNQANPKIISDAIETGEADYRIKSDWKLEKIVEKAKAKLGIKNSD